MKLPSYCNLFIVLSLVIFCSKNQAACAEEEPPTGAGDRVYSEWNDRFYWRSADGRNELQVFGMVQTDGVVHFRGGDEVDWDQLSLRRARLYLEGTTQEDFYYRLMTDFGQNKQKVLDAFVDLKIYKNVLKFRVGKFKQPFSFEQFSMEDMTLVEFERSMIDLLSPGRNIGLMLYGRNLFGNRFDYFVSMANGLKDADIDENRNQKDFNGRVALRPFAQVKNSLQHLQLGISGTIGYEQPSANNAPVLTTPLGVTWISFYPLANPAGTRVRVSPEVVYIFDFFSVAAQYIYMDELFAVPNSGVQAQNLSFKGFYILTSWMLTPERRTNFSQLIKPQNPFSFSDPFSSPGAFEATFRISSLKLSGSVVDNLWLYTEPQKCALGAFELSAGVNWYLNRSAWVQLAYERAWFDSPITLGPASLSGQDSAAMRFSIMW